MKIKMKPKSAKPPKEKKRNDNGKGKYVLLVILIILAIFVSLIGYITDFMWFKELGYVGVFFKKLFTQLKIGIPTFL
ncbi:UPF0182 family protein, partial [Acinetobacter baumannii]|nr:UPF0182 family protein [Acinetobacter baumannii]